MSNPGHDHKKITPPICYACKKPILGQPLVALNRTWHTECFRCALCHEPVNPGNAVFEDNHIFHQQCNPASIRSSRPDSSPLPIWMQPQRIVPRTIQNRNNPLDLFVCGEWDCRLPIGTDFFLYRDGSPYHVDCYTAHHGSLSCDICGGIITGQYLIDEWGNAFCTHHDADLPRCASCGRRICQPLTNGGVVYSDGRKVCDLCRKTAVDDQTQVSRSMRRVRDILGRNGLLIDEKLFPIRLVDVATIDQIQKSGNANTLGLFQSRSIGGKRQVEAVNLLWGMPAYALEGILAHELGHAWMFLNHVDDLEEQIEEGLCNLLKYTVNRDHVTRETLYEIRSLFKNPDPIYGEGFRRVERLLSDFSVGALMRYVAKHRALPSM